MSAGIAKPSDDTRDGPYVHPKGPYPHIMKDNGRLEAVPESSETISN